MGIKGRIVTAVNSLTGFNVKNSLMAIGHQLDDMVDLIEQLRLEVRELHKKVNDKA